MYSVVRYGGRTQAVSSTWRTRSGLSSGTGSVIRVWSIKSLSSRCGLPFSGRWLARNAQLPRRLLRQPSHVTLSGCQLGQHRVAGCLLDTEQETQTPGHPFTAVLPG